MYAADEDVPAGAFYAIACGVPAGTFDLAHRTDGNLTNSPCLWQMALSAAMRVNSVRIRRGLRRDVGSQGRCIPWPGAAGTGGG